MCLLLLFPLTGSRKEGTCPSWLQARGGDKKQPFTLTFAPKVDLEPPVHLTPQMHGFGLWKLEDPERTLVDTGGTRRVHRNKPLGSLTPETCGCVRTVLPTATQWLHTPKIIYFMTKWSFTLQQISKKFLKSDVIRRGHLCLHAAPFPKWSPVASLLFPAVTCSVLMSWVGSPARLPCFNYKPRLLKGRGWADGRWKKGRANELKRERASERAAIRDRWTTQGSPVCWHCGFGSTLLDMSLGKGQIVDITEPPTKAPFDRHQKKPHICLIFSCVLSATPANKDMGFDHI